MPQIVRCRPHWLKIGLALAIVLTLGMGSASAQLTDPQLAISGPGASGQDPVQLGNTNFVTVLNRGNDSGADLTGSWYLILGVANTTDTPLTSIATQIISVNGLSTSISGTYETAMYSNSKDAYSLLENVEPGTIVPPTDGSELFTNWAYGNNGTQTKPTGGEVGLGINPTSFSLFQYQINTPLLHGVGGMDTIDFNSDLPLGTYVIGYGLNSQHTFSTPFTEAGFVTGAPPPPPAVPAPSSVVLLGIGLAVIVARACLVRSWRRAAAA